MLCFTSGVVLAVFILIIFHKCYQQHTTKNKRIYLRNIALVIALPLVFTLCNLQQRSFNTLDVSKLAILISALLLISLIDIQEYRIPNKIIITLLCIWAGLSIIEMLTTEFAIFSMDIKSSLKGAFLVGGIFLSAFLITKGSIGAGDVKMTFIMGLYLGYQRAFAASFYALLLAASYGLLMIVRKQKTKEDVIPFAPFAFIGTIIASL